MEKSWCLRSPLKLPSKHNIMGSGPISTIEWKQTQDFSIIWVFTFPPKQKGQRGFPWECLPPRTHWGSRAGDRLGEAYSGVVKCEELGGMQPGQGERDCGPLTIPDMTPGLSKPLTTPQVEETHSPRWSVRVSVPGRRAHSVKKGLLGHPDMTLVGTVSHWALWASLVRKADPTWPSSEHWSWAGHLRFPTWKTRGAGRGN